MTLTAACFGFGLATIVNTTAWSDVTREPNMPHPFLDNSFHVRWSALAPDAVEADISKALVRADRALNKVINQDRGKLSFESVMLGYEDAIREVNESWG